MLKRISVVVISGSLGLYFIQSALHRESILNIFLGIFLLFVAYIPLAHKEGETEEEKERTEVLSSAAMAFLVIVSLLAMFVFFSIWLFGRALSFTG